MRKFSNPSVPEQAGSLAAELVPLADELRDMLTDFGFRPYKVRIVRVRWSGTTRGEGVAVVESSLDLMPTPLVQDLSGVAEIAQAAGLDEVGSVMLSEVSGRYTEEQLLFLDRQGVGPDASVEVFYEVEFPQPAAPPDAAQALGQAPSGHAAARSKRRRFFLRGAPQYLPLKLQWVVRLERAHNDRDADGGPG